MKANTSCIFCFLAIALFFTNCNSEKKGLVLSTDITVDKLEKIYLSNIITEVFDTLLPAQKNAVVNISEPQIIQMTMGNKRKYIYVEPGSELTITGDSDGLTFIGSQKLENEWLEKIDKEIEKGRDSFRLDKLASAREEAFLVKLDQKYEGLNALVSELERNNHISPLFKKLISKRITSMTALDKVYYPRYFEYFSKDSQDLSPGYFAFLEENKVNDADLLAFSEGRDYARGVFEKEIEYEDSVGDYYKNLYNYVGKVVKDKKALDYYRYQYINDKINFGGGVDGMEEIIDSYMASVSNATIKNRLQEGIDKWASLKKGMPAPSFDGMTKKGELVNIRDLKGKNVYIDVWATWCGPCIAEIPALKEVENNYHGKNIEFVSISIDSQKDKEKWMKFIEDRELGGTQLFEDGAWESEITQNYNIKGIPRFILVDSGGNIVSADAPRPSSNELKKEIDKLNL